MNMKVRNMLSTRTGRPVANQFEVKVGTTYYFQSYNSVVAVYEPTMGLILGKNWDYSITTMKYLYQFLDEHNIQLQDGKSRKDSILKAIESGKFMYDETLD